MVLSWLLNSWRYLSLDDCGTAHSASGGALREEEGGVSSRAAHGCQSAEPSLENRLTCSPLNHHF